MLVIDSTHPEQMDINQIITKDFVFKILMNIKSLKFYLNYPKGQWQILDFNNIKEFKNGIISHWKINSNFIYQNIDNSTTHQGFMVSLLKIKTMNPFQGIIYYIE